MKQTEYKRIAIIIAVILTSLLAWGSAHAWLSHTKPFTNLVAMLWPALLIILLAAVGGLALMLLDRWIERIAAILGAWASFVVFWSGNVFYLSALPVFGLLWLWAWRDMRDDMRDRLKVRVGATLGRGMKFIVLGVFLMLSLGFYLTPHAQQATPGTVSQSVQQSFDDAYQSQLVQGELAGLPQGVQVEIRQQLGAAVDQAVRSFLRPFAAWIPPIIALALFLILGSISFIFRIPALWLSRGLFWMLKQTGFVKIETKSIQAEVLSL